MRSCWRSLAAVSVLVFAPLDLQAPLAQSAAPPAQARVIVKFKGNSPLLRQQGLSQARRTETAASLGQRAGLVLASGVVLSERMQVVTARGLSSAALAQRLAAQSDVEYAEPDQRRRRAAPPNDPRYAAGLGGNGPAVGQWYLRAPTATLRSAIDAEAAWDITTGSASVVVAVLDTGVRYEHEDLRTVAAGGNLLPGYDMISDVATANDGDGRDADPADPGDWVSSAEAAQSGGPFDDCDAEPSSWHGSEIAGLVGALTDNGLGMASVGRQVRVLPVRVLGKCGGYDSDIIAGMRWAAGLPVPGVPTNPVADRARVINLSLGGEGSCSQSYRDAISAVMAAGAVVVASSGNSAGHAVSSPANCPGMIAVSGLRHTGTKVGFADIGPQVAISAPGGNCVNDSGPCLYPILTSTNAGSTTPATGASVYSDSYNVSVGTSFSAPMVAGTVGLMLSAQPAMTPADVRAALQGSARSFPHSGADSTVGTCSAPGTSDQLECYCTASTCGAGMLDAGAAVAAASRGLQARITLNNEAPVAMQPISLSGASSFVLSPRALSTYQWTLIDGGGIVTALGSNGAAGTTVTPTASGRFIVSLSVTDSTGAQSTTTRSVDVQAASSISATALAAPAPSGGSGGGGGALGLLWLLGLGSGVMALWAQRRHGLRAKSIPWAVPARCR